ncbi:hypothetical protein GLAREA_02200 [Glarea lozoyensis ATCC 20868]|uniref:Uncharacterized protein n=1 Tax=Glarea lozoyensis (strain ATCC 20868 / MF5171) TaxID=1116229 RepID=S3DIC0_GLAL2|nr:uncharacterized protein GLAREA_02200 [Glarea lozoyensis ATCC 20868]EPE26288.1 hypothetical protein GLAREA_02200 [Glarea lozoyensis ATCC 20868]
MFEVFYLASTCHRNRNIWMNNANSIFETVRFNDVWAGRQAYQFFLAQSGTNETDTKSVEDIRQIVRHYSVVENAILVFERQIVSRVTSDKSILNYCYGPSSTHPPTLTMNERFRFIKSYYTLWSFLNLPLDSWYTNLIALDLREVYVLWEMCNLQQSIGKEEAIPPHPHPDADPDSFLAIHKHGQSQTRKRLQALISLYVERISVADAYNIWDLYKGEGSPGFMVIWDHSQPFLAMCCGIQDREETAWYA